MFANNIIYFVTPGLVIGLREEVYTANENVQFQLVCTEIKSGVTERDVTVSLFTSDDTAEGKV